MSQENSRLGYIFNWGVYINTAVSLLPGQAIDVICIKGANIKISPKHRLVIELIHLSLIKVTLQKRTTGVHSRLTVRIHNTTSAPCIVEEQVACLKLKQRGKPFFFFILVYKKYFLKISSVLSF
jgi:hypothetical protein